MLMDTRSDSQSPAKKSRPKYVRSCTSPRKCHPAQIARAQLGDIRGAIYLPMNDPFTSPTCVSTTACLFGPSGTVSLASIHSSLPTPQNEATGSDYGYDNDMCEQIMVIKSNDVSLAGNTISSHASGSTSTGYEGGTAISSRPPSLSPSLSRHSFAKGQDQVCLGRTRDTSPEANQEKSDNVWKRKETDSACDPEPTSIKSKRRRRLSSDPLGPEPTRPRIVRFASDKDLHLRHSVNPEQSSHSTFLDPFTGTPAPNDRRRSDSSDVSGYLRPNAFAAHRDTLARLQPTYTLGSDNTSVEHSNTNTSSSLYFTDGFTKRFYGHRDTLARLHFAQNKPKTIPVQVVDQIMHFLSFDDYKNLRLTCQQWLDKLPYPILPSSFRLPAEVLQQVYRHLHPCDFDSARHTCRSWFLASLDRQIGHYFMKKAGCHPAFVADLEHRREVLRSRYTKRTKQALIDHNGEDIIDCHDDVQESLNEEWLISKRLATECRLSAAWHGSGLSKESGNPMSRLAVTERVHFHRLTFPNEEDNLRVKRFTVSACGRFVLVVVGIDIFVYSLDEKDEIMQPCVRLVAGGEVLSVSMDTSSGRFAVAALLEGRVGMCWELYDLFTRTKSLTRNGELMSLGMQTDVYGSTFLQESRPVIPLTLPDRQEQYNVTVDPHVNNEQETPFTNRATQYGLCHPIFRSPSPCVSPAQMSSLESSSADLPKFSEHLAPLPIRTRPTNVYKNLGCPNDNPRSVAICPQRKCVAYGCRTGIELHWVDALTGRDLNRWFPLSAPSDFLYFLPRRPGIDSAKKLRLISSAAGPNCRKIGRHNSTPAKWKFSPTGPRHGRQQSMTRLFFGSLPFPSGFDSNGSQFRAEDEQESQGVLRTVDCDHYHAIPLSDGIHMLFTDPSTGLLCLGSDAPLGGPTKLVRKVCMMPPPSSDIDVGSLNCYTAGRDLSRGVRVVAAYDDGSIVLFNIPSDCFDRIRYIRSSPDVWDELTGVMGQSDLLMDVLMVERSNALDTTQSTADASDPGNLMSFRSLQIDGALICRVCPDVEDLQVDCYNGGLRLWVFHRSGEATRMDIYAPRYHQPVSRVVGVDGLLRPLEAMPDYELINSQSDDKGKAKDKRSRVGEPSSYHVKFGGLDGASDFDTHRNLSSHEGAWELLGTSMSLLI